MHNYIIYDANNSIVGKPTGYAKYSTAQAVATRMRYKLWATYDAYYAGGGTSRVIYRIELKEIN
jgi:hypothetical protein